MDAPVRPHRRLKWKYTGVVVALVAAASPLARPDGALLLVPGQQAGADPRRVEHQAFTATSIEQLMQNLVLQLESSAQPTSASGAAGQQERSQDFHRLLAREELLSELRYLDAAGREQVRINPLEVSRLGRAVDFSESQIFRRARAEKRYLGRVYFQNGWRPHMTIAVAERVSGGRHRRRHQPELRCPRSSRGRESAPRGMRTRSTHRGCSSPTSTPTFSSVARASPRCRRWRRRFAAGGRTPTWRPSGAMQGGRRSWHVPDDRPARLARLRRGTAERGIRAARVGDLAHRDPARRVPAARERDRRLLVRRLVRPIESI